MQIPLKRSVGGILHWSQQGKRIISQVNITFLAKIFFFWCIYFPFLKTTNIPELNQFVSICNLNSSFLLFLLSISLLPSFLALSFPSLFLPLPLLPLSLPPSVKKKLFITLVKDGKANFIQRGLQDSCRNHCNKVLQQKREIALNSIQQRKVGTYSQRASWESVMENYKEKASEIKGDSDGRPE